MPAPSRLWSEAEVNDLIIDSVMLTISIIRTSTGCGLFSFNQLMLKMSIGGVHAA
jgi:hypothetical protein